MTEETKQVQEPERVSNPLAITPRGKSQLMDVAVAREITEVQAALVVAQRFPRDEISAMDAILNACTRMSLAESATYDYSRGGNPIHGPSIKLAEVLAQKWGHIHCGVRELAQSNGVSTVEAYAWDVQTGMRDAKVFEVKHIRSRSEGKGGSYAVEDPRDVYELVANAGARRKRACILAVIPGDVIEAAVKQCEKTLSTKMEVTEERLKEILDAFAEFGVSREALEKRIQRRFESMTPGQMLMLRKIKNSLADQMSSPADWFELGDAGSQEAKPPQTAVEKAKAQVEVAAKRRGRPPKAAEEPQPPQQQATENTGPQMQGFQEAAMPEPVSIKPPEPQPPPPHPSKDELIKVFRETKDPQKFNEAMDLVRDLPDVQDRLACIAVVQEERKRWG